MNHKLNIKAREQSYCNEQDSEAHATWNDRDLNGENQQRIELN